MRKLLKLFVAAWLGLLVASPLAAQDQNQPPVSQAPLTNFKKLKEGDIVFIESNSERAPAIKKLTGSKLTHCGIAFRDKHDKWIVYEGAGRGKYLELADWIAAESGQGQKPHDLFVKRLKDANARVTSKIETLKNKAKALHDTTYDLGFAWENKDSDGKEYIYCSELVWKAFKEAVEVALGTPHPLSDYIVDRPGGLKAGEVRGLFDEYLNNPKSKERRDGKDYKAGEMAISPVEVFASTELEPVTDQSP